jgi:hypothetical protein
MLEIILIIVFGPVALATIFWFLMIIVGIIQVITGTDPESKYRKSKKTLSKPRE